MGLKQKSTHVVTALVVKDKITPEKTVRAIYSIGNMPHFLDNIYNDS